jgi:hypothetical protein
MLAMLAREYNEVKGNYLDSCAWEAGVDDATA